MSVIPSHQRLSRKQDDVEAAEQSFRQLVANVSDYGIYILDTNGRVTSWNLGAEKIKAILPQKFWELTLPVFILRRTSNVASLPQI